MGYNKPRTMPATIPSGETTTGVIALLDGVMVGIQTPGTMTSTAFTFKTSGSPAGDYEDLYDSEGNQVSVAIAATRSYTLTTSEADAIAPWPYAKVVGDQAEGAERELVIVKK